MTLLKNDTFLRALLKQPVEYTPIWMKAGSFLDLCKNTELATEVTIQPLERFDLDAAILFSDILTVPDAMGLGLYFAEGEGPKFERALQHEADIAKLHVPDMEKLQYVFDAVTSIRKALDGRVPLIGFSGSPFTLACYMVEGGSSKEFRTIKTMMYSRPDLLHKILKYIRQIVAGLKRESEGRRVPVIVFAKGGGLWLESMAEIGADALGLDWTCNIGEARRRVGNQVALQGNFDPFALFGTPESIRTEVARILADYGHGSGHVFNLGHGINQHADPEHAKILVDTVHELSRQYHGG